MSTTTTTTSSARRLISGWGRSPVASAAVVSPRDPAELAAALEAAFGRDGPVVARGLGRSYGDAAQCAGGTVIDCTGLDTIHSFEPERARLRVGAGISLDAVMRAVVPLGFFVPVTPGTRFVTVGGAVAADIHGKNHHVDGSIAAHLEEIVLHAPSGRHSLTPGDARLDATLGGMGLTGIIEEATLRLRPIPSAYLAVDTHRAQDLGECMAAMSAHDAEFPYVVAWIDCLARGRHLGRSVLTMADHARPEQLAAKDRDDPFRFDPRPRLAVPFSTPGAAVNRFTMAAFNEAYYRRAPRHAHDEIRSIAQFFHPLDAVGSWNRLYGTRGFTQYQFVVPFGEEAVLAAILEQMAAAGAASFLAVLKRFGPASSGHLSFPAPGWTLAVDLGLGGAGIAALLDSFDEQVAAAGGRVYLAKDGRLRPQLLQAMYPRLSEWQEIRAGLDPDNVLGSDLAARLSLGRR